MTPRSTHIALSLLLLAGCGAPQAPAPRAAVVETNQPPAAPLALAAPAEPPPIWGDNDLREQEVGALYRTAMRAWSEGELGDAIQLMHYAEKAGDNTAKFDLGRLYALNGESEAALYWIQRAALHEGITREEVLSSVALAGLMEDPRLKQLADYAGACRAYWRDSGALEVEVVVPAGHDPATPVPVVLALHGYLSSSIPFARGLQPFADAEGVAFVSISATIPYSANAFVWADDAAANREHILGALDSIKGRVTAAGPMVTYGFSQGGQVALDLVALDPERFVGALALSPGGASQFDRRAASPKLGDANAVIIVGDGEAWGNIAQARANAAWLKAAGVNVMLRETPDQQRHAYPVDFTERFGHWLGVARGERPIGILEGASIRLGELISAWPTEQGQGEELRDEVVEQLPDGNDLQACLVEGFADTPYVGGYLDLPLGVLPGGELQVLPGADNSTGHPAALACVQKALAGAKLEQGRPPQAVRFNAGYAFAWGNPPAPTGTAQDAVRIEVAPPRAGGLGEGFGIMKSEAGTDYEATQTTPSWLPGWLESRSALLNACIAEHAPAGPTGTFEIPLVSMASGLTVWERAASGDAAVGGGCLHVFEDPHGPAMAEGMKHLATLKVERTASTKPTESAVPGRLVLNASGLEIEANGLMQSHHGASTDGERWAIEQGAQVRPFADVFSVLSSNLPSLQACADRMAKQGTARVHPFWLTLVVLPDGSTRPAPLQERSLDPLVQCSFEAARSWTFGAPKRTQRAAQLSIPVVLQPATTAVPRYFAQLPQEPPAPEAVDPVAREAEKVATARELFQGAIDFGRKDKPEHASKSTVRMIRRLGKMCSKRAEEGKLRDACGSLVFAATMLVHGDPAKAAESHKAAREACSSGGPCADHALFELLGLGLARRASARKALKAIKDDCEKLQGGLPKKVACDITTVASEL